MKEFRVTFKVRFQGNPDNLTAAAMLQNMLRLGNTMLRDHGAERSEMDVQQIDTQGRVIIRTEDSWTCRCNKCGILSYHDSDPGQPCVKAPLCGGTMEPRAQIEARLDRDARR